MNLFSPTWFITTTDPDVIKLIDTNMNDVFIKEDIAYLTFQINQEKDIDLKTLTNFMETLEELSSQVQGASLSVQMNLNSLLVN